MPCATDLSNDSLNVGWHAFQALLKECSEVKKLPAGLQAFLAKHAHHLQTPAEQQFETLARLGEGGYGQVELAERKRDGVRVALKRMEKRELLRDLETNFDTELAILSLNLRRNVGLIEAFQTEDALCLAMEWAEGGTIADMLDENDSGGLPLDVVRYYAMETILALEELHHAGYVHCDVKPGNLLLTRDGYLKLADFGSATKLGASLMAMRGTPDYAAPEMLQLKEGQLASEALDCWSLGVLIYEMITGIPPFYHDQLAQTFARIEAIQVDWSVIASGEAADLLRALLCPVDTRLNMAQIKEHLFFSKTPAMPPCLPSFRPMPLSSLPVTRKPTAIPNAVDGHHLAFAGWGQASPFGDMVLVSKGELDSLRQTAKATEDAKVSILEGLRHSASQDKVPTSPCLVDLEAAHECLRTNHEFLLVHYDQVEAEKARLEQRVEQLVEAMEELATLKQELERDLGRERAKVHDLVGKLEQVMRERVGITNDDGRTKAEVRALRTEVQRLQQKLQQVESTAVVSRMPSFSVVTASMEGELRWLEGRKWRRLVCKLNAGALYSGDQCLLRLNEVDQVWWVQGVSRKELPILSPPQVDCAFKIRHTPRRARSIISCRSTPQKVNPKQLEVELEREKRIRDGALQLVKAAIANSDQARLADAHVEAATKRIEALKLQLASPDDASSIVSVEEGDVHSWESTANLGECACCQLGTLPGGTMKCSGCGLTVHRECQGIVPIGCTDVLLLQSVSPIYLLADSREEAHRWRLALSSK